MLALVISPLGELINVIYEAISERRNKRKRRERGGELRLNVLCSAFVVVCCRGVQLSGGPSLSGLVSVSRGAIGSC